MSEKYPFRFTLGHVFFFVLCISVAGVLLFYLGAHFGPELLWGIKLDPANCELLLPDEEVDAELKALLAEESSRITFHEVLEKENPSENGVLDVMLVPETSPDSKPKVAQNKKEVKKEKAKTEQKKKEIKLSEIIEKLEMKTKEAPKKEAQDKSQKETEVAVLEKTEEKEKKDLQKEIQKNIKTELYTLQVGSFSELAQARAIQKKFKKKGYSAFLKEVNIPQKGKWYRVQVGRYPSELRALKGKESISRQFQIVPLVVKLSR